MLQMIYNLQPLT